MSDIKNLSTNIRKYRKLRGLSQASLAERLFVTPQTVSKWECALAFPDLFNLCAICEVLGVSADMLLGESEDGNYMIAIDGGGTKTEFVLFEKSGRVRYRSVLGATNPNVVGLENACDTLMRGIDLLLSVSPAANVLFAGIAGSMSGGNKAALEKFLTGKYPKMSIHVDSDIRNVINSAPDSDRCVTVICGTGSVVYVNDGERLIRTGGWGYLFDETVCGFSLGRSILRECFLYGDGLKPASILVELAEKKLGGRAHESIGRIYSDGRDYIASFAPLAFEAAEKGDSLALEILKKSIYELADQVGFAVKTSGCRKRIIMSGGLTRYKNTIEKYLCERLGDEYEFIVPDKAQIYGAARMCMICAGEEINGEFEMNFEASYNSMLQ